MLKPFGRQILIEPVKQKTLLTGENTLTEYGKVIAIGNKVEEIKVGDVVGFLVWGLNHLDIDEVRHYLVYEDDQFLLGTITDEK